MGSDRAFGEGIGSTARERVGVGRERLQLRISRFGFCWPRIRLTIALR